MDHAQRGRKPADVFALSVNGKPPRLTPPESLNADERALFAELVAACDPTHFRPSDLPLLTSFIQATLQARDTAHDPDKFDAWERVVRLQTSLATKLRLCPHSRADAKTIGRQPPPVPKPWV
jgi:hypothetical protein